MTTQEFKAKATALIDDLKGVCANYGLANDGENAGNTNSSKNSISEN